MKAVRQQFDVGWAEVKPYVVPPEGDEPSYLIYRLRTSQLNIAITNPDEMIQFATAILAQALLWQEARESIHE